MIKSKEKGKDDRVLEWTNKKPKEPSGQQSTENVIKNRSGVRPTAKNAETPKDCFNLFVTNRMLRKVVKATNQRIQKVIELLPKQIIESNKYTYLLQNRCYRGVSFYWTYA